MSRTLILGGGFGGLTVATRLRSTLGDDHEIVLIDRSERFVMGSRKLWALVGLGSLEEGSRPRALLAEKGISYVPGEIAVIDPVNRTVVTSDGQFAGDYLVVALGADPRPDLVPGLAGNGHNIWDPRAVPGLIPILKGFTDGRIAVVIAGVPYTCPPAPYECAMLLDDHLRERGVRDRVRITVSTLQPILLPNAGAEGSAWLAERLADRGISFQTAKHVREVQPDAVHFEDATTLPFDLLIGVPPHRPPPVVGESGLAGDDPWIPVDPATLRTRFDGVYAIGDVTKIPLANGSALPKAGVMAELQGERVAAAIAADVRGEPAPSAFDGRGYCFMELGKTTATLIEGDFFAVPAPSVALKEVSQRYAEDKHRFEAERLGRWFGW